MTPDFLASLACKYCGRTAAETAWAREGEGATCAECRSLLRRAVRGSKEEKAKQMKQLEDECRTEEGKQHFRGNNLQKWLDLSESQRGLWQQEGVRVVAPEHCGRRRPHRVQIEGSSRHLLAASGLRGRSGSFDYARPCQGGRRSLLPKSLSSEGRSVVCERCVCVCVCETPCLLGAAVRSIALFL